MEIESVGDTHEALTLSVCFNCRKKIIKQEALVRAIRQEKGKAFK